MSERYKQAGVDIDAGNEAVERIKSHVSKTYRPEVRTDLGGFGGLFSLQNKYEKPILVSGTDGVGTKLKVAIAMDNHQTIGIDLVAMCVNDILVYGAEPLFFLDYIATGKLQPEKMEEIIAGIADGCIQAGCSLIGGEMAEMPGMYQEKHYDLAGFAVGVIEEEKMIDGKSINQGDVILGLSSSGLHSNGYSLARHLLLENDKQLFDLKAKMPELEDKQLGEVLLEPTKIYVKPVLKLIEKIEVKGMAHITGGGFIDNIPRTLPEGLQAVIQLNSWNVPPIFSLLQQTGDIPTEEMYRTFNMGIGFIIIVSSENAAEAVNLLEQLGEEASIIGKVQAGEKGVIFIGEDNQ